MDAKSLLTEYFSDFENLLGSENKYDVKIRVGEEPNVNEFHAHSSILSARCSFFKDSLSDTSKENGYYVLVKANISDLVFKIILK